MPPTEPCPATRATETLLNSTEDRRRSLGELVPRSQTRAVHERPTRLAGTATPNPGSKGSPSSMVRVLGKIRNTA